MTTIAARIPERQLTRAIVCCALLALTEQATAQDDLAAGVPALPRTQATGDQPLPIARRANVEDLGDRDAAPAGERADHNAKAAPWANFADHPWMPMAGSLAVVLVVFFALMSLLRRGLPAQGGKLPPAVLEVLGHATIGAKQQLHLLRCGHKLLLTCTTAAGMQTLAEIIEPAEVERLAALCRGAGARKSAAERTKPSDQFGAELSQEPAQHSFVRGLYRESTSAMS